MAMIATRISGDSRCHFAIRISTSVAAEACAAELPRLAPRPAAPSCVSSDVSESCVPIANPPSSVRLRPEPLFVKPSRCADNSGHRGGFFVSGLVVGGSLGSESGASQFANPATACRVLTGFVLAGVSTGSRASPTPAIIEHPRASRRTRGRSWGCWSARRSSVRR